MMDNAANETDPALPAEVAEAMKAADCSPTVATLMSIIEEFTKAKARDHTPATEAKPAEAMWPLQALVMPVHGSHYAGYQKALRAAKSGQLEAEKVGGRWFCTERAMHVWLAKTGQAHR
jgi:hypothetical protein